MTHVDSSKKKTEVQFVQLEAEIYLPEMMPPVAHREEAPRAVVFDTVECEWIQL
jgi:hypothetical protein